MKLGETGTEFGDVFRDGFISETPIGLCGGVVRGVEEALSLRDRVSDGVGRTDAAIRSIDVFSDAVIVDAAIGASTTSDAE